MHTGTKVIIGVGGNIGTGKTTVSRIFAEFGARYISADEIGWEVLPEIAQILREKFGDEIMKGKQVDKKRLREIVFSDVNSLRFLNRASHPVLTRRVCAAVDAVRSGVVVIDAALLFDWPEVYGIVDYPILVKARRALMAQRAAEKGIGRKLFDNIISMQKDDEELQKMASHVIENNGEMSVLRERCQQIYEEISHDC
jgi:dephospho-CoA kinase